MMANDSTYCRKARFLPLVLLLVPGACEPSHNSSIEVQWAAVFETPIDWCTLTFAKANGSYAKHHVDIVLLSAEEGTEASLLHELDVVHESFDDCVHVHSDSILAPSAHGTQPQCYELHLDDRSWQSMFLINASGSNHIAIYSTAYLPELSPAGAMLRDDAGALISVENEYVANSSDHHHDDDDHDHDHEEEGHDHDHEEDGHDHDHEEDGHDHDHEEDGHDHDHEEDGHDHDHEEEGDDHVHGDEEHDHEHDDEHAHEDEQARHFPAQADFDKDEAFKKAAAASVVVMLITLIGVATLVPCKKFKDILIGGWFEGLVAAFAAGALLAVTVFLLLSESIHLVESGYDKETEVVWRWGSVILAGFLTPALLDIFLEFVRETVFPNILTKSARPESSENGTRTKDAKVEEQADVPTKETQEHAVVTIGGTPVGEAGRAAPRARIVVSIIVGDFLHNFSDGVFIGAAFAFCGSSTGWSVAISTAIHELAQELSDFLLLTNPAAGGLSIPVALGLNCLSGTSILMGAAIVIYSDVENSSVGLILAFGAGIYIYLAACECMPRVHKNAKTLRMHLGFILAFLIGATAIGLVLLDHEHCEYGGHAH